LDITGIKGCEKAEATNTGLYSSENTNLALKINSISQALGVIEP
jgi:hypothetical protein